jgi:hypothetical protein
LVITNDRLSTPFLPIDQFLKFRYSIGNCKDPRFDATWAPCISKELQQQLDSEEFKQLKKEWQFQVKADK